MMRVLFLSDVPLTAPTSGAEQVLYNQAIGLANAGFEVFAITRRISRPSSAIREVSGVVEANYSIMPRFDIRSFSSIFYFPRKFFNNFTREKHFDIVIIHQPLNHFILSVFGKLRSMNTLYVFHSPWYREYFLSNSDKIGLIKNLSVGLRFIIERFCLKRAHKFMTLSNYMKHKIHRIHGIPQARIEVNPGGVNLDNFSPSKNRKADKEAVGFKRKRIHLLTIRNLEPRMGLDRLLQCISKLKKLKADVHLIIGGAGEEATRLKKLIINYRLSDDVTMSGFIPAAELFRYYAAADFFILPSQNLEGFGLVTPESMACGTPVLGTPVGGTKEILSKFTPQFIFHDSSPEAMTDGIQKAIHFFVNDPEGYRALRKNCRKYAQNNYSWQRHVNQLSDLINEIWLNAARCNN